MASNQRNVDDVTAGFGGLGLSAVAIVKSADEDSGKSFISSVNDLCSSPREDTDNRVAFDCEGVNLSRLGSVEIVSICFPGCSGVYLIDFGKGKCPKIVKAVKELFSNSALTKIIHDCRMDCDALYHKHGIKVNNVHDTSAFHDFIGFEKNKNLNDTLGYYGICVNVERDKAVYKSNPNFWATRPLTQKMIDWASADVDKLFQLADKQLERISSSSKSSAIEKSTVYAGTARDMKVCTGLKVYGNVGRFIGLGGANIRSLERETGCLVYSNREDNTWFVFYPNDESLNKVKRRMKNPY